MIHSTTFFTDRNAIPANGKVIFIFGFNTPFFIIEKNLGKMYDPIVGIDVLDNWDEITSVVNR